jgi:hypothetical protein
MMLDKVIESTLCALDETGLSDNLIFIISTDNGASEVYGGSNLPYKGSKGTLFQGGVRSFALYYGSPSYLPDVRRGATWSGLSHITDWYPTLLGVASQKPFTSVEETDGVDILRALVDNTESPRSEIFHNYFPLRASSMQINDMKLIISIQVRSQSPAIIFKDSETSDDYASVRNYECISAAPDSALSTYLTSDHITDVSSITLSESKTQEVSPDIYSYSYYEVPHTFSMSMVAQQDSLPTGNKLTQVPTTPPTFLIYSPTSLPSLNKLSQATITPSIEASSLSPTSTAQIKSLTPTTILAPAPSVFPVTLPVVSVSSSYRT